MKFKVAYVFLQYGEPLLIDGEVDHSIQNFIQQHVQFVIVASYYQLENSGTFTLI